ncbi:MAG TPA: hypothetical protein PK142_01580, partial [bacterium]|nr:hypothetical protein [bacterium]
VIQIMKKAKNKEKISYPLKSFRLAINTVKALNSLKKETDKSYNLLFLNMIAVYQKNRKIEKK